MVVGKSEALKQLDTAMAELCARLREHFEAAGHSLCPDPECGESDGLHAPNCAYVKYTQAQDAAIATTA